MNLYFYSLILILINSYSLYKFINNFKKGYQPNIEIIPLELGVEDNVDEFEEEENEQFSIKSKDRAGLR